MPEITDPPPTGVLEQLRTLSDALDAVVSPRRLDDNLLIATWNLRAFGDVSAKWRSEEGDSPQRDLLSVRCITEIVSRFDVIAIQEVHPRV